MRSFDYTKEYRKLLSPDIVSMLTTIHEFRGEQSTLVDTQSEVLEQLLEIAKIQSTEASNRIEGIITTDDRLKKIVREKTMPKTRSEKEIAGYRDVLNTIHSNYEYIPPRPSFILQLHRDLYKFTGKSIGGSFKNSDNVIAEELPDGTRRVRFEPIPAWETSEAMDNLWAAFEQASNDSDIDPLMLIPLFVLDFLCIHPFNDGNGRMSRLLTLLLLYRDGYKIGKYISLEKLIADSKETYYEVLQESSQGWHKEENDYGPFVRYMLGIVIAAYRELNDRLGLLQTSGLNKAERIEKFIRQNIGEITKSEIMEQFPDISQVTVQRTLANLLNSGMILKIGGGRYTSYVWNGDNK